MNERFGETKLHPTTKNEVRSTTLEYFSFGINEQVPVVNTAEAFVIHDFEVFL
jgi:hypothetical protein